MKRSYTAWPLDRPDPGLRGATKIWMPILKIRVQSKHQSTPTLQAVVDSGAPYCLFRAEVASFLHIDLKSGPEGQMGGVIGGPREPVYFHQVNVVIENNYTISVWAAFMKKLAVAAILGRAGFFDRFRITFDHEPSPPEFEIQKIDLSN